MKSLKVNTSTHEYSVYIDKDIRFSISELYSTDNYSKVLIITDDIAGKLYLNDIKKGLPNERTFSYSIPHGETSKSIRFYYELLTQCLEHNLDRESLIIALGGGVVGDIAGFVAATFMRGIDYIQVPTTILAHDSSVGGKVAINHELGKNLIGSFYPPKAVIYDVNTLKTLPENEIRSGYAEILKEAYIANQALLDELFELDFSYIDDEKLIEHLYQGIKIKASIVEADEHESNIRKYLNFGHTLAHAIEKEMSYGTIAHGEAVAIGMLFALELSQARQTEAFDVEKYRFWLVKNEYPLQLPVLDSLRLIEHMKKDKKTHHGILQFVLLDEIGQPVLVDMTVEEVDAALTQFLQKL